MFPMYLYIQLYFRLKKIFIHHLLFTRGQSKISKLGEFHYKQNSSDIHLPRENQSKFLNKIVWNK